MYNGVFPLLMEVYRIVNFFIASVAAFQPWQALINGIVACMEWLFTLTQRIGAPSYVLVILILTIVIKLLTQPLMNKQMRSTRRMQLLAPEVEEIKKRYATNPQKMNQLTMELYKEHGASPTAGCLPLLIQMPILIAFYNAIRRLAENPLNPEYFQIPWLGGPLDLGQPDPTRFLLPLIAAVATLLQQLISTANLKDRQQRMMLIIFPVIFFFMVQKFPAMLALYWIFYSVIGAAIYWPLKRKWAREDKIKIEAMRRAKEEEERQKAAKKVAAREAARKRAEERRQTAAKAAAKAGKPLPEKAPNYFDMLDDPDFFDESMDEETLEAEKAFRTWLREQGVERVNAKKFREHPWSSQEEVVEMGYLANGNEYTLKDLRAKYEKFQQQAAAQAAAAAMMSFGRKKKKQKTNGDGEA